MDNSREKYSSETIVNAIYLDRSVTTRTLNWPKQLTPVDYTTYNPRLSIIGMNGGIIRVEYAIIRTGGKQFRVSPGDVVRIPSLTGKNAGDLVEFTEVLAEGDDNGVRIGAPVLAGARVTATVVKNGRGPKIIVFKFKRRKQYKRKQGHRQGYTAIKIDEIS
jgi:large subunit ribosomal protein L21